MFLQLLHDILYLFLHICNWGIMCKYIQGFALPPKAVTYSKLLFLKNYSSTRLQNEKTFAKKTQNMLISNKVLPAAPVCDVINDNTRSVLVPASLQFNCGL